ncbi:virulence factor [Rhodoligotrophos defluvii]|uniref:virulence factor n=1 Tax=Rhodoligotrophos defluvii TaxID=2561934 RepID=UPI0010C99175|nr:virulence factor [Rhodoligotrophos defluvii]
MGELVVVYWRDIPAQVIAKSGRRAEKRQLSERFQEAIDMAAMRSGAAETGAYLDEWRRGAPEPCGDDLAAEAGRLAASLEQTYDRARLKALIANGGRAAAS